ncbi:G/U mismatch-specific DNA glycosylase [Frigoriglobus tundricola]|uniref:G/U mismatch-specific uracil DNA glycosylase n=1 Tax=Frigoriglobus tundricola TaxID=2774151 RepID=A0A6M5YLT5_9BACT|nr:G/U mismatch-specific DNA glycosylase [Frigoriglobus tundricola]QJW93942.1 G/U mismatch-specific uracil DNA glycosylase [Frigoriglobus tundricola]
MDGAIGYEPDVLAPNLDVIFCGINPAATAAAAGHNFSDPSNRFWPVLHLSGFTDERLDPRDERRLLEFGCGITAVVRRPAKRAGEVTPDEFRRARRGFEAKVRRYAPRSVAFLGKRAYCAMIGRPDVDWGLQPAFAGAVAWVLPNPSGLNRGFPLEALVRAYSELRQQLRTPRHPACRGAEGGPDLTQAPLTANPDIAKWIS